MLATSYATVVFPIPSTGDANATIGSPCWAGTQTKVYAGAIGFGLTTVARIQDVLCFRTLAPESQLIFTLLVGLDVDQPCCVYGNRDGNHDGNPGELWRTSANVGGRSVQT